MSARTAVGVLASGAGSNLRALLDAASDPGFPAEVVLVCSNRRDCGALHVARQRGVEALSFPVSEHGNDGAARDAAMVAALRAREVQLVVCAGYDRVLSDGFLEAFPDAILNVHPSLLPAFGGGMTAVEEALAAGVTVTGCTVHLLAAGAVDAGPIVLQAAVPVLEEDDDASLRARIHEQEWRLLPEAVALWARGCLHVEKGRVRRVQAPQIAGLHPLH
ncbi:MAG: phosphoribosylglycinamide formyltransferase [Candidatus Dormibacteria bacterium]